jgi:hypothetical protein
MTWLDLIDKHFWAFWFLVIIVALLVTERVGR